MPEANCTVDGCDRGLVGAGFCSVHYQRNRKHGDPRAHIPIRPHGRRTVAEFTVCCVDGCERRSRIAKQSLCGRHYQRWLKHGDATKTIKNMTGRYVNKNGYVALATGTPKMVLEHRLVMEQMVGRPLLANENVHHINGIRDDNRPENLELWVRRQPPGQRVTDRVTDAIEILRQYAPHLLDEEGGAIGS